MAFSFVERNPNATYRDQAPNMTDARTGKPTYVAPSSKKKKKKKPPITYTPAPVKAPITYTPAPIAPTSTPAPVVTVAPKQPVALRPDQASYTRPASAYEIATGARSDDRKNWGYEVDSPRGGFSTTADKVPYLNQQARASETWRSASESVAADIAEQKLRAYRDETKPKQGFRAGVGRIISTGKLIDERFRASVEKNYNAGKTGFDIIMQRARDSGAPIPNWIRLPSPRMTTTYDWSRLSTAPKTTQLLTNPAFILGAPAVVATGGAAIPYVSAFVGATAKGAVLGIGSSELLSVSGAQIQKAKGYREFAQKYPLLYEETRQYARAKLSSDAGGLRKFFNLAATGSKKEEFATAGSDYLRRWGVRGESLASAEKSLAGQAVTERGSEVSTLLFAELIGEGAGGSFLKFAATTTVEAASSAVARREMRMVAPFAGGAAEGAAATASMQWLDTREVKPTQILLWSGVGAVTAGTFELFRTAKTTPKKMRALLTVGGNIIEPQEFVTDQALNVWEGAVRRRSQRRTVPVVTGPTQNLLGGPTTTPSSSRTSTRSPAKTPLKSLYDNDALLKNNFFGKTETKTESTSLLRQPAKQQANTRVVKTWVEATALQDTLVKAQAQTKQQQQQQQESTRTLTPPIPAFSLGSWSGSRRSRKRREKSALLGYSQSISAQIFGKGYKAIGAQSTDIGILSGLGVRF